MSSENLDVGTRGSAIGNLTECYKGIHPLLLRRVHQVHADNDFQPKDDSGYHRLANKTFVLYLPTVNLRLEHNPAFAFACHLANWFRLPLIVLAVILDDASLPPEMHGIKPIVMTSRRLSFLVEATASACMKWHGHGAGCAVRVHGPQSYFPDHLTLAVRARAVVTDEPFVHPFLQYVQAVEKSCRMVSVPCFRVDGSTTVPPCSSLTKVQTSAASNTSHKNHYYYGVPDKAWLWQRKTESQRMDQMKAALSGAFDPPELIERIVAQDFFHIHDANEVENELNGRYLVDIPERWKDKNSSSPGQRPWTITELSDLLKTHGAKSWSLKWPGADSSVPPCQQTTGTSAAGMSRWNHWLRDRKGLVNYAKQRNNPALPHAPSRMSCYLNFGIVSIFKLAHEVKAAQAAGLDGAIKFEEELIKWREMSYAHAFSRGDYYSFSNLPPFARASFQSQPSKSYKCNDLMLDVAHIDAGNTGDCTWDAMQKYLINTGELHNNARMTWGKTVSTAWNRLIKDTTSEGLIKLLCYLNDRYALDGLSPPSYAGVLWCFGWCDKPDQNGFIRKKDTSSYKMNADGFIRAEMKLFEENKVKTPTQQSIIEALINQDKHLSQNKTCSSSTDRYEVLRSIEVSSSTQVSTKESLSDHDKCINQLRDRIQDNAVCLKKKIPSKRPSDANLVGKRKKNFI